MIDLVINARNAPLSEALEVRRILPFRQKRMVGPFIFMDHAGPLEGFKGRLETLDVLPHPHIGLSTVSYLLSGNVTHRDSLGVEQMIEPGEVNWMTAGRGISHSERFEDPAFLANGGLEMLQTWVALPTEYEEIDPGFENFKKDMLPEFTDKGIWMRLIAGEAFGLSNGVKTLSPMHYLHVEIEAGVSLPAPAGHTERASYIVKGTVEVNNQKFTAGQMIVFTKNANAVIKALEKSTIMLLGGEPLGERFIWWNFVSSSRERIEQAKSDWKNGRIVLPPNDDKEFIPLPDDKSKPASTGPAPEALS